MGGACLPCPDSPRPEPASAGEAGPARPLPGSLLSAAASRSQRLSRSPAPPPVCPPPLHACPAGRVPPRPQVGEHAAGWAADARRQNLRLWVSGVGGRGVLACGPAAVNPSQRGWPVTLQEADSRRTAAPGHKDPGLTNSLAFRPQMLAQVFEEHGDRFHAQDDGGHARLRGARSADPRHGGWGSPLL